MIELKSKKGECSVHMSGDFVELTADMLCCIKTVYAGFKRADPKYADKFEKAMREQIGTCFEEPDGKVEVKEDKAEEARAKIREKSRKELAELLASIKKWCENED